MRSFLIVLICLGTLSIHAQHQEQMNLNGTWQFELTKEAFPPQKYTRKIPVPGLIHLAEPRIPFYDKLFKTEESTFASHDHNLQNMQYEPHYYWYKKTVNIPQDWQGKDVVLTLKKSKYVTTVYVNGMEAGSSIECYTPIDVPITAHLKPGENNEILVRVGERIWLPSEAAGSTDKEKINYLPGIWDDVYLLASNKFRVSKSLLLPSLKDSLVTAKVKIRSFYPSQLLFDSPTLDTGRLEVIIREKKSGKTVATSEQEVIIERDKFTETQLEIPLKNIHAWSPEDPFLYEGIVRLYDEDKLSDEYTDQFGMRNFGSRGKFFALNGEKYMLRGTNITLHRFFEDPACQALPWDREWVKKLIIDVSKKNHWNGMRICVGLVPDFWYDLADEYGIVLQNEWLYWQKHGWDEQVRKEYTNWVWSDGNHPSIVIWDGINENWDDYIGAELVPELMKLDPTRIWDAGFMTAEDLGGLDMMDEPHPYVAYGYADTYEELVEKRKNNPYPLGDLGFSDSRHATHFQESGVPQLANEYGWFWLWRDGQPSKLTVYNYRYYLGENSTIEQNREFQAYALQLQTEWLRAQGSLAGIFHFCNLTNNYGFTGDGFVEPISELKPTPMLEWFSHCFAPAAVFVDMTDERYMKDITPHKPGERLAFNFVGVNDLSKISKGKIDIKLLDSSGKTIHQGQQEVSIPAYGKVYIPYQMELPKQPDGYLLTVEYLAEGEDNGVVSRRYIKVGDGDSDDNFQFYHLKPEQLAGL